MAKPKKSSQKGGNKKVKSIKETIQSRLGFYIGDAQKIIPKRLKHDARIHCAYKHQTLPTPPYV